MDLTTILMVIGLLWLGCAIASVWLASEDARVEWYQLVWTDYLLSLLGPVLWVFIVWSASAARRKREKEEKAWRR